MVGCADLTNPVSSSDVMHISSDLASAKALKISETQFSELLNELAEVNNAEESIGWLNASQTFGKGQNRYEIAE